MWKLYSWLGNTRLIFIKERIYRTKSCKNRASHLGFFSPYYIALFNRIISAFTDSSSLAQTSSFFWSLSQKFLTIGELRSLRSLSSLDFLAIYYLISTSSSKEVPARSAINCKISLVQSSSDLFPKTLFDTRFIVLVQFLV